MKCLKTIESFNDIDPREHKKLCDFCYQWVEDDEIVRIEIFHEPKTCCNNCLYYLYVYLKK